MVSGGIWADKMTLFYHTYCLKCLLFATIKRNKQNKWPRGSDMFKANEWNLFLDIFVPVQEMDYPKAV